MQELITNPKTHVIITWKDGEYYINNKQHEIVLNIGLNDTITIDGNTIYGKSISEIITVEEKNRRDFNIKTTIEPDYFKNYSGLSMSVENFTPSRRKKAMEKVRDSFIKYFEGKTMSEGAKVVLKNINYRVDTAEW